MIPKPHRFANHIARRPLSCASAIFAVLLMLYSLYQLHLGNTYLDSFNWIDGTTFIMIGVLLLRGISSLWRESDLQAVSIALVGALSFVFAYEAIYKLAFFIFPWRMPPAELREFVIQVAIALTASVGFAFGTFRVSAISWYFLGVFVIGGMIWLAAGFPQIYNSETFYRPILNIHFAREMIYMINRATKIALCLVYYFFYSNQRMAVPSHSTKAPEEALS